MKNPQKSGQISKAPAGHMLTEESLVAVPISGLRASAGSKENGSPVAGLKTTVARRALVAPKLWCPHPANTVCMQVSGGSMEPYLQDGYLIVVDKKQNDRKKLSGKIVVAQHNKSGLAVSRYWNLHGSESFIPDNHKYEPVSWNSSWKITGKVLWWIGHSD